MSVRCGRVADECQMRPGVRCGQEGVGAGGAAWPTGGAGVLAGVHGVNSMILVDLGHGWPKSTRIMERTTRRLTGVAGGALADGRWLTLWLWVRSGGSRRGAG